MVRKPPNAIFFLSRSLIIVKNTVEKFYGAHEGKFFYQRLVYNMGSGPLSALVIKGMYSLAHFFFRCLIKLALIGMVFV